MSNSLLQKGYEGKGKGSNEVFWAKTYYLNPVELVRHALNK